MGTMQIVIDRDFQGVLKFLLERAAREYRESADNPNQPATEETRQAWRSNAARCLEVAAQLRRT